MRKAVLSVAALGLHAAPAYSQVANPPALTKADPLAPYVKASGSVQTGDGPALVELLSDGNYAAIRVRFPGDQRSGVEVLTKTSEVLALLADKRMHFLWAALTQWAGPTLELMRDRQLTQLQAAAAYGRPNLPSSATVESTSSTSLRPVIQLARFLIYVGKHAEAEGMLERQLRTMSVKKGRSSSREMDWFNVGSLIATSRESRDDIEGALAQYDRIAATLGDSSYAMNVPINRAALMLARHRYAEALAIIEPLWLQWSKYRSYDKVEGSERQFAWIRACALEGLGRHDEADEAFLPVLNAKNTRDRDFVIDSDLRLKMRGLICMRRKDAVKAILLDSFRSDLNPSNLLDFQLAFRPFKDREFWASLRADPELQAAARERMRELPPEMTSALNGWRDTARP